jgi:hypothetical protein
VSQASSVKYSVTSGDSWDQLRFDATKGSQEDRYWTLRVFGLEGSVSIPVSAGEVRWGGYLLDLACGMADWLQDPVRVHTIHPVEQSNDVSLRPSNGSLFITSGGQSGHEELNAAVAMLDDWLVQLSSELAAKAPDVLSVPGFEWATKRALASQGSS